MLVLPSEPLRKFVSHYWLSLDNAEPTCPVFPDGAVDLVIQVTGGSASSWLYGTTTTRTDLPLALHDRYLGVRFKPGQARHFIDVPAHELTDGKLHAQDVLDFPLHGLPEGIGRADIFAGLNDILERHLAKHPPVHAGVDDAIALIHSAHGAIRMQALADAYGKSIRQLERVFLEAVGISPKYYAAIARFYHAAALMKRPLAVSATVAADAGYTDQSHMIHAFRRLAGMTPLELAQARVAFLQDPSPIHLHHQAPR